MACQQQNGNSTTQTTTDPQEAARTPQVQTVQCGGTHIHTCITGGSASSDIPMYVNMNQQYTHAACCQQPSTFCQQPSASSATQHFSLIDVLEADAVRSNSSRLSHSDPPKQPPPTHPGSLPTVPEPPSLSANTQHRRNAKGENGKGGRDNDPLFEQDPWNRTRAEREKQERQRQEQAWKTQQDSQAAWNQFRTPVNSGTQHNPHPDHAHAQTERTPKFSPFKPLNTNERVAWSGQQPDVPLFPGSQPVPIHVPEHSVNPFAQTFMPSSHNLLPSSQNPFPNPQTHPAAHPSTWWTQQCIPQPEKGHVGGNGSANEGSETMQQHLQRLQERWNTEQARIQSQSQHYAQPLHAAEGLQHSQFHGNTVGNPMTLAPTLTATQQPLSFAQQLANTTWTPQSMNANMPEFLPNAPHAQLPYAPSVFPGPTAPNSHLLGPLLPGYRMPVHDNSRVQEFLPTQDVEMQGSGQLPGPHGPHACFSQNFHAIGANERPFMMSDLFTEETLPGMRNAGVGKWGADVEDDTYHTPMHTAPQQPIKQSYCASGPPPPPPGPWTNPFTHGPGMPEYNPQFPTVPITPIVPHRTRYHDHAEANYAPTAPAPWGNDDEGGREGPGGGAPPSVGQGGGAPPPWGPGGGAPPPWGPIGGAPPQGGIGGGGGGPPPGGGVAWGPMGGPMGPRPPPKRWLPPPAWTPGISGGLTYRQWLWQLSGWAKLTAMSHEDRGVAVALSLGGRAARIAQTLSHAVLSQVNGLHVLLTKIEQDLGAEMQDRVRTCAREFKRYVRPKGMSASEFVVEFERRYTEAHAHGLNMSVTLLTIALLEQAQLSESQESWILQCVAGDLTQYDAIRRAMRRVPNLDHRHQDASAWQLQHDDDGSQDYLNAPHNSRQPRPFQDGGLNVPPAEQIPHHSKQQQLVENQSDYYPTNIEEESDSDDDYCSTCPSNEDQETCEQLCAAYAITQHRKSSTARSSGRKHFRRGFQRPKTAWVLDTTRNANDTVPPGWDAKRWLARTKCPGCGSRWHRNCQGQGKTHAIIRKKGGHRKGGKGRSKGGSSSSGGKGGGHSFGVFLTTMAAVLTGAQSFLVPQSNHAVQPLFSCNECMQPANSKWNVVSDEPKLVSTMPDCFSKDSWQQLANEIPAVVPFVNTAFHAYHLQDYLSHDNVSIVGLEPLNQDWREANFAAFTPTAKMRFALLMDTGAPQSAAGEAWLDRFICEHKLEAEVTVTPFVTKLSGIGSGSATVQCKKVVPTGMYDTNGSLFLGRWEAQQLEGIGKLVPPLCGFESMCNREMIISMQNPLKPTVNCIAGTIRTDFELIRHQGHILLPIDWGGSPMPSKDKYISDPLGLNVWFSDESSAKPNDEPSINYETTMQPPQHFQIVFDNDPYPYPNPNEPYPDPSSMPPQTFTLKYEQPPYTNPALAQQKSPALNITLESSQELGPDDPLQKATVTSMTACPAVITSNHEHITPPPGLKTKAHFQTNTANEQPQRTNTTHDSLSKEKRPESQHSMKISKFSTNRQIDNDPQQNVTNMTGATYAMIKQLRLSTRQQQRLAKSATYQRKYRPLPPLSPVPPLANIACGKWDFWEWWAGSANMSKAARVDCHLVCGPPITRECGWELSLPHHQLALLHLLDTHKPSILYAGPTCAPWSQANTTMEEELKSIIRELEEAVFSFFALACRKQVKEGRDYVYEQPRNSALLKTSTAVSLAEDTNSVDQYLCMCMHDLKSPSSGLPHMKPSVLRGTVLFTERTLRWCNKLHKHEQLNGRAPGGGLKTSYAQLYTKTFCKRCCRDMRSYLKGSHDETHAYPLEDDDVVDVTVDPYQAEMDESMKPRPPTAVPTPLEERPQLRPTAKRSAQPASSSTDNPLKDLAKQWDEELEEAVDAGNKAADQIAARDLQQEEPVRVRRKQREPQIVSDLLPAEPADAGVVAVPDLVVNKNLPVPIENEKSLHDMRLVYTQRISSGITATIQAGQRMRLLQELFGTPSGVQILAAVIAKHPTSSMPPEPIISRVSAPLLKEVYLQKDKGKWQQTTWMKYSTTFYAKKPFWVIYLYGIMKAKDEIVVNPFQELADLQQDALQPLQSLPRFLKAIVEGTNESRVALILGLHKRLYHRSSSDLKKMLHQAGVPLHILAFVDDAVGACETCRAYANTAAKPLVKLSTAPVFNDTVYFDLVFFSNVILFIAVDESIRYMVLAPVEYKSYDSLETAYRRNWVAHFGPPRRFRSDRESVFNSDKFGVYLASQGTTLEMITAGDQHSWLGLLDRRVQLVRRMYPKLLRDLSNEHLCVEHEDAAAECMIAVNTQSTYGGTCPYVMLYGTLPAPLFPEDSEYLVPVEAHTVFYEHQLIRSKAIASFHAAVIEEKLERTLSGRSRNNASQQKYTAGMHVDFFRKSEKKQLEGWRGPATILSLLGEGYVTLRWQSHSLDIPVNHIRPHIHITPIVAAPSPPVAAPVPLAEPAAPAIADAEVRAALVQWENYWFTEASNTVMDDAFVSLVSCAALMPINTSIVHGLYTRNNVVLPSAAAERDSGVLFGLGKDAAHARSIQNYIGVVLMSGKRFAPQADVKAYHCAWWTGDASSAVLHEATVTHQVDFINLGVTLAELSKLRAIVFLEGETPNGPPLHELLKFAEPEPPSSEGRVRVPDLNSSNHATVGTSIRTAQPHSQDPDSQTLGVDDIGTTRAPTEARSEFDATLANLSASELFSLELRGININDMHQEAYIAVTRRNNIKHCRFYANQDETCDSDRQVLFCDNMHSDTSSSSSAELEFYFMFDGQVLGYYPLEKDTRPLTPAELIAHAPAVSAARLKELSSWVEHHTGVPVLKTEYEHRTGLRGLASRWLTEWKRKEGVLVVKDRLVLKGFMEQNQKSLQTSSPTATRMGHRVVTQTSADEGWDIEGLDISTAFLQGFSFDQLPQGTSRQPCAFIPPEGVFKLLASLSDVWREAADNPHLYLFELHKSVYGLKDAPLMWFIAINDFLKSYGLTNCSHDQCLYKLQDKGKLVMILSLHVDDTLSTGQKSELNRLHTALEARFGKVKREVNSFRHFGVDVYRSPVSKHITCSQEAYLKQLKPIGIERKRGDGRTADTAANTAEITLFRSLVSAIAWLGVTYPPALAAASLYQGFLPAPTIQHILHLNACLQQFFEQYQPLVYRHGLQNKKLIVVPDSSLGNNAKYSQGGYVILLSGSSNNLLCGPCSVLGFKSSKSKRVASSTLHAETLALVAACEEAAMIQTFLYEVHHPLATSLEMMNIDSSKLIPMVGLVDCHDLLDTLCRPTMPVLTNKAMTLYTAVLREFAENGKVEHWGWIDTRDNPANCLTKLQNDGTLDLGPLTGLLRCAAWEPLYPYRWGLQLCDPQKIVFDKIPSPPIAIVKEKERTFVGPNPV